MVRADTSQRILDTAERLVQTRGFNGFSYADIATTLGVTKASLHYHFPAKAELGQRLIERYEKNFLAALEAIDQTSTTAREKLKRYARDLCGRIAQQPHVSVRDAGRRIRNTAEADEGGDETLLRRKRALADRGAEAGSESGVS